jgi:outer membrane protein
MKGELIQELLDAIARDVRIATLSAEVAFRRIGGAEAFQNQTTQAPLNLAQTWYKLGLSSIVELSPPQHFP